LPSLTLLTAFERIRMVDSYAYAAPLAQVEQDEVKARLGSLDAFRGLAMLLMVAEVMHLCRVARSFPDSPIWQLLCFHQSHKPWEGCSVHDMIQPAFSFMVGVALPFSISGRMKKGQSMGWVTVHAFWRALVLILLGIFLRSLHRGQTYYTFEDTLTQIGLGYGFLFVMSQWSKRAQWISLVVILIGYWGAFALYPTTEPDFNYEAVGVPNDWPHLMSGFKSHWNKNSNLAHAVDLWLLNLFPRESPFAYNGGGYQTLSFIPTLGTMIMGLLAGGILSTAQSWVAKLGWLLLIGAAFIGAGAALEMFGYCPLVKRIWTPSFALYSGGWCFVILALFYVVIDIAGLRFPAFPLIVIGMNSIAIYCMSWTIEGFIHEAVYRHFSDRWLSLLQEAYHPLANGVVIVLCFWLILYWMYRRHIFLRI